MAASLQEVEEICLIDGETDKEFKIILNRLDAEKARTDVHFATKLLEKVKRNATIQSVESNNTLLVTNNASTYTKHSSTAECTSESTESTHLWNKAETTLLLQTYSEYKDQFRNGKGTVKQYWEKIAKIMQEKGYDVTGVKCSTKFQALKRTYKAISDHNKKTGNNRKEWEYLQIMQELFSDKPWIQPLSVAGSHVNETEEKENILEERGTKRKKKLNAFIEEYILNNDEERKRRRECREKEHKEKMLCFKGIQELMQQLLQKEDKS